MKSLPLSYRSQLIDSHFKKILFTSAALRYLETLLEKESLKLERMRKTVYAGRSEFGMSMVFSDAYMAFPEIKKEVDAFLGLSGVRGPALVPYRFLNVRASYAMLGLTASGIGVIGVSGGLWYYHGGSWPVLVLTLAGIMLGYKILDAGMSYHHHLMRNFFYTPLTRAISIPTTAVSEVKTSQMSGILAHEYAHYIEDLAGLAGMFSGDMKSFKEGFACGIQRYIASLYSQKENNEAFLYHNAEVLVNQMQEMSRQIRRALGMPGRKRDEHRKTGSHKKRALYGVRSFVGLMNDYAIGSVVFFLLESKYGPSVYKDIIHGRFDLNTAGKNFIE